VRIEEGCGEKPEEQILLKDAARMTKFYFNEITEYVVGLRRGASVGFLSMQK
jgi:hypothetical protein